MGGGSGGGVSGHGVDVFEEKKSDEEEVFFVLECRIFGQSGTIAICFVTLAERIFWARASRQ
jgi:hypothetical protein